MTKKVKKNNIDVTEEEVEKFLDEWDNAPDIIEMVNYKSEDDCTNEIEQKKVENAVVTNNGLGFDKPEQVFIRSTDLSDCCSSLIIEGTNICVRCKKPCNPVRDRMAEFLETNPFGIVLGLLIDVIVALIGPLLNIGLLIYLAIKKKK